MLLIAKCFTKGASQIRIDQTSCIESTSVTNQYHVQVYKSCTHFVHQHHDANMWFRVSLTIAVSLEVSVNEKVQIGCEVKQKYRT